jgi:RNA polymerase sigma-70 factor (ECF subfamily)
MQIILHKKIERATLADEKVFKDIYRKYFVKLYRFALSLTNCKEASEEIVHDVLLNLWKKRNLVTEIENVKTYLYVSVKNLSLNHLRNAGNRVYVDVDSLYNEKGYISIDPESLLISKEQVKNLNEQINKLPLKCRIIFRLIKEDGLKYREVASLLNISVKTVENQLIIALKKIASAINHK